MTPSSSTSYPPATTGAELTSSIYANRPGVFRITPGIKDDEEASGDFSLMKANEGSNSELDFTADYTNENCNNGHSYKVSLSGMNAQTFKDLADNERIDNEYILLLWPKKTNKVFFNIANFVYELNSKILAGTAPSNTWGIGGVSYLAIENSGALQNAYWQNVPFEDTTKVELEYRDTGSKKYTNYSNSLSQSGYISFNMPTDWESTTLESLCGGQFSTTTLTSGSGDIVITGSVADEAADGMFGKYLTFTRTGGDLLSATFTDYKSVGAFKYAAFVTDTGSSTATGCDGIMMWVAGETGSNGCNGLGSSSEIYLMYGKDNDGGGSTDYIPANLDTNTDVVILIRRINIYDVMTGFSKIGNANSNYSTAVANQYPPVDSDRGGDSGDKFPQTYPFKYNQGFTNKVMNYWSTASGASATYAMKIELTGSSPLDGTTSQYEQHPMLYNIIDASESHVDVVEELDDSAYNLCALGVTSDLSIARAGQYLTAVTKKGRVSVYKTGIGISSIGFMSIATGDTNSATAFADQGPSSMYGRLHMIRKVQAEGVPVYWDEIQKDGTYVRFWGVIQNLTENHATGGPTTIKSFNFEMVVTQVALIDANSKLMTDIFPLGGIEDGPTYT